MYKAKSGLVLLRGGGDLASGVALRLHRAGIRVVITELAQPRLRYDADGRELRITATRGEVLREGEQLRLTGEVRAVRAAAGDSPQMSFASGSLTIWPEDERAETAEPVVLTQGVSTAHANGLRSDNLFGTLELIGNARVRIPRTTRTSP